MMARTNIISIELVNPHECAGSSEPEDPSHDRTQNWELALMHVVGEDSIELFRCKCSQRLSLFCC